jgi:hypothetical protein
MEVEWHSSSVPVEQLDAALSADRNLTLRWAERLLADSEQGGGRMPDMAATKLVKVVHDGQHYWLLWHWESLTFVQPASENKTGLSAQMLYASGPFVSAAEAEKAVVTSGWTLMPFQMTAP